MFFICVAVSIVILASKYHSNVLRSVQNICHNIIQKNIPNSDNNNNNNNKYNFDEKYNLLSLDQIILADSLEKCDDAVQRIRCNLSNGILGFDCEWVNNGPISLLQLATYNGTCVLFRLGKIGHVPPKLQELLANDCILKVGVGPYEDGKKLMNDYGCTVVGTVDLRTLANHLGTPSYVSLAALCLHYLGIEMDKILDIRCGDWNADTLTNQQIEYAAYDAVASIRIYQQMQNNCSSKSKLIWSHICNYIKKILGKSNDPVFPNLPKHIIDTRYRMPSSRQSVVNKSNNITNECENSSKFFYNLQKNGTSTRKQPLYHNCYLQAPDGETLCTCDRKKAEWYITKKLGVKIKDEPYIVRLNFEPSGRACGKVGQYYTQFKVNQCVVCGAQDKFMKKNIVPKEYRKYFPLIMKAHQSHDILLLCPTCHTMSNRNDLILRRELAMICDAPLSYTSPLMNNIYHRRRKFMSAEKALRLNNTSIPPHRIQELEARIIQYSQQNYINSHKSKYMEDVFDNKPFNNSYSEQNKSLPHGLKVVQYFTNCQEGGLVLLERMWRKHFIDTMHPKYLPQLWSLDHNQERLEIRINQNRIEPQDAKISGIIR